MANADLKTWPLSQLRKPAPTRRGRGAQSCIACGQAITRARHFIHLIDGGSSILARTSEDSYNPDTGDMGLHPIGPECARQLPAEFLHHRT